MKDIRNLTEAERKAIFKLMKPIGHKEGDKLHCCEVLTDKDGGQIIKEIENGNKD